MRKELDNILEAVGRTLLVRLNKIPRGITDSLVRLSVGIENIEDLRADLENALGRV